MLDKCVSDLDIISYFKMARAMDLNNGRVREVD
jgi:hypothetical protein